MKSTMFFPWFFAIVFVSSVLNAGDSGPDIDRRIEREPKYQTKPRYLLLAFGPQAKSLVWVVQDGDQLYLDKNGNRDLTDDGMPTTASQKRSLDLSRWDGKFVVAAWTLDDGSYVRDFELRHWNYADPVDQFGLSLTFGEKIPMYAGWDTLFATSPTVAKVVYFGGPVAPRILRIQRIVLGTRPSRFSVAFVTPRELTASADSKVAAARLSIEALPASVTPRAVIDWPVAENSPALQTTHELPKRCCYWEFYTESFQIPERAIAGKATVTIVIPSDKPFLDVTKSLTERKNFPLELSTDHFELAVVNKE